ncbi:MULTISPECIES: phage tail protein [Bacillaceae]|uniref:phage tail protein n=1 Tax=Shouchella oshimensis TaxID=290588 RepID=UPI0006EBFE17|nr:MULTISPECIES: tail fiber domain-containing protein [Bacillaceae]
MKEMYVLDQNDSLLTTIGEDNGLISALFREELNQLPDQPLRLTVDSASSSAQFVKEENQVVFRDKEGELRLYVIKEVDDHFSGTERQTYALCEPAFMELKEHLVKERSFKNANASVVLDYVLSGTRWRGQVDIDLGVQSIPLSFESSVDAIWSILRLWGGEFKDTITFSGNQITSRTIKILSRRGQYIGKRFEVDHDIQEIQRTVLSYPVTALYGQGASSDDQTTDFSEVTWQIKDGDPANKPKGQEWIGDEHALTRYGRPYDGKLLHREGVYTNSDIEDPETLLHATWEHLQRVKQPEVHYQLTVQLLEQLSGYEHEKVSLGDTALAFDRMFTRPIEIQARVIAIEYDLMDVNRSATVEMGQFLSAHSYDDRLDQVIREINDNRGKWNQGNKPISPDRFPDILPDVPANVEATGGFQTVQIFWAFNIEAFYVQAYELFASEVKGFLPSPETLVYRGSLNGFNFIGETNKTYYFRVRAVNYHGRASNYSAEVEASTARVVTDDILFGPELAMKLRELNKEADIIGTDGIQFEQIANDALELIQQRAKDYSDQEIADVYSILTEELEKRMDRAQFDQEVRRIHQAIKDGEDALEEKETQLKEEIGQLGEELTSIEKHVTTEFEKVDGRLSATLSKGEVDELLTDKVDYTTYNQKMTTINASLEGIDFLVGETSGQVDQLTGEVTDLRDISSELSLNAEGFTTSIRQLQSEKRPTTNLAIGTYKPFVQSNWTNVNNQIVRVYNVSDRVLRKEVTISCKIKLKDIKSSSEGSSRLTLQWFENNPNAWHTIQSITNLNENREIEVTQTRQVNPNTTTIRLQLRADFIASGTVEITELMVTEGKRTAAWSPAFEDLIDAESYAERQTSLDSTLEGITGKVEETTNDLGTLTHTVGQFKQDLEGFSTSIGQVSKGLDSKVDTSIYDQRQTSLNVKLDEITGKVESTSNGLGTLTNTVSEFRQDLNGFSTSVEEIRKDLDNKVDTSTYNQRQTSLDATLKGITGRVTSTESGLGSVTSRVGALEITDGQFATQITEITNNLTGKVGQEGVPTTNSSDSYSGSWTRIARLSINSRYHQTYGIVTFTGGNHGGQTGDHARIYLRLKQQNAMGDKPFFDISILDLKGARLREDDFRGVLVTNASNLTVVDVYLRIRQTHNQYSMTATDIFKQNRSNEFSLLSREGWVSAPPTGLEQYIGSSGDTSLGRISKAETAIEQTSRAIALLAKQEEVDSLTGRMSTSEGRITVMSDQIDLRVKRDGIISAINLSPERVKIDTRLLQVGDFTNLVDNGDFEDDVIGSTPAGWIGGGATVYDMRSWSIDNGSTQTMGARTGSTGNIDIQQERLIKVVAGDSLYVEFESRFHSSSAGRRHAGIGFRRYDAGKNHLGWTQVAQATGGTTQWRKLSGTYTVPAGTAYIRIWVTNNRNESTDNIMYADNIVVRRMTNTQLLVNGSITANHMSANSITAANGALANASITRANLQNAIIQNAHIQDGTITSAKIASLSADKISAGTVTSISIRSANIQGSTIISDQGNRRTSIEGGELQARGRYTRTWFGNTNSSWVNLQLKDGYFMAHNETRQRRLYYSDFGISTYLEGFNDEDSNTEYHGSGVIEFFSHMYNGGEWGADNVRGLTAFSNRGNIALKTNTRDVILDADRDVKVIANRGTIVLRPRDGNRSGNNHFVFNVKNNSSASDTDGWIAYGSPQTNTPYASGLRFKKTQSGRPTIWATNGNGDYNSGVFEADSFIGDFEARESSSNAYMKVDGSLRVTDRRGYNGGNVNYRPIQVQDVIANSIRVNLGTGGNRDLYLGCSTNEVRVTNNSMYNNNNIGYRPIRASNFHQGSSRTYKDDIQKFNESGLDHVKQLDIMTFLLKSDLEAEAFPKRRVGIIAEDSPNVVTKDGMGVENDRIVYYSVHAIQELDKKVEDTVDRVSFLEIENQLLKRELHELKERLL